MGISIYLVIRKGMYCLHIAENITNDELKNHLVPYNYTPVIHTVASWTYSTNRLHFSLVVDDFTIKYSNKACDNYILQSLMSIYTIFLSSDLKIFLPIHYIMRHTIR